jgi:plastocyanin
MNLDEEAVSLPNKEKTSLTVHRVPGLRRLCSIRAAGAGSGDTYAAAVHGLLATMPVTVMVAASVLLAGCGGGGAKTSAEPGATSAKTIVVDTTEFKLEPSVSRVKPGTYTFRGVNRGTIPHVVELEGQGLEEETETIQPGESKTMELTLNQVGKYELYCPLDDHKKKGMVTEFTVEF